MRILILSLTLFFTCALVASPSPSPPSPFPSHRGEGKSRVFSSPHQGRGEDAGQTPDSRETPRPQSTESLEEELEHQMEGKGHKEVHEERDFFWKEYQRQPWRNPQEQRRMIGIILAWLILDAILVLCIFFIRKARVRGKVP